MKKSEMRANKLKTAQVQRLFRARHKTCIFDGSDFIIEFEKVNKMSKELDLVAKCNECLIDRHYDIGLVD